MLADSPQDDVGLLKAAFLDNSVTGTTASGGREQEEDPTTTLVYTALRSLT